MARTTADIDAELADIQSQLNPLVARQQALSQEREHLKSVEFIRVNNVRRNDIELSRGKGKPFFGMVTAFADWMRKNRTKRFCEWNGRVYFTADILDDIMDWNASAYLDDVPEEEET